LENENPHWIIFDLPGWKNEVLIAGKIWKMKIRTGLFLIYPAGKPALCGGGRRGGGLDARALIWR